MEKKITGCREHIELSREAAREGMVLLKNDGGALPLKKGERVALFGRGSVNYVKGGGGSGDVFCQYVRNVCDGMRIKEAEGKIALCDTAVNFYREYYQAEGRDASLEPPLPVHIIKNAAEEAEAAIAVISRFSREGADRELEGDYYLSEGERYLLSDLKRNFKRLIVVLNVGAAVDCGFIEELVAPDAILLAWQAGMEGGLAVADLLCGDFCPSGRLVDTFVSDYSQYPFADGGKEGDDRVKYYEDIYVGYRYFETMAKDGVLYPFGFGLSYTEFSTEILSVEENEGAIVAKVKVTNVGAMRGKQVVQMYFSAPQGVLGKPALQLAAFGKTEELEPGTAQVLTLSFSVDDMASYDDTGKLASSAYVLEKGDYYFYIGGSVRDNEKASFVLNIAEDTVVKQLEERLAPCELEKRLLADGSYEALPTKAVEYRYEPQTELCRKTEDTPDFKKGASVESIVAAATDAELCLLLGGSPGTDVVNTGCFGGLQRFGVMPVPTADGPAGLRLDAHHGVPTTAFPCATLLACSWNESLVEKIGAAGAAELKENGIKVWLTPALNIHRTPLCGRNFEYFSEDPIVAGRMAAAKVRGIQSLGVACSIKHFAANNIEKNRIKSDSIVSERALREIYLRGFEICVREANPYTVMTAYNLINGIHASESYDLITGILRGEWGFKGMVTTDWGIKNNPVREVKAGNDMKMHLGYPAELMAAIDSGELTRAEIEACAKRILTVYRWLA